MEVLPKRFANYELTLHPEKTKLIDLNNRRGKSNRSFDFLGFTHYLGKSRKENIVLKRKTSSKRLTRAIVKISKFIKLNRHMKLKDLIAEINVKLRGHYSYYGITFNYNGLCRFYFHVLRSLYKWLNRRGGKSKWNWETYSTMVVHWNPLVKPYNLPLLYSFIAKLIAEEPDAEKLLVRVCGGAGRQRTALPGHSQRLLERF